MSENMLIPLEQTGVALKDADFAKLSSSGDFLPRVQLATGSSKLISEKEFRPGEWGLISGENCTNLTKEFQCVVISYRAKALKIDGADLTNIYSTDDPEFAKIAALSKNKDSGCMYGAEFLIWLPDYEQFATLFLGSPTGRKAAPKLKDQLGKSALCGSEIIKTPKYTWNGPTFGPCSVPVSSMPDPAELQKQVAAFVNVKSDKIASDTGREV